MEIITSDPPVIGVVVTTGDGLDVGVTEVAAGVKVAAEVALGVAAEVALGIADEVALGVADGEAPKVGLAAEVADGVTDAPEVAVGKGLLGTIFAVRDCIYGRPVPPDVPAVPVMQDASTNSTAITAIMAMANRDLPKRDVILFILSS